MKKRQCDKFFIDVLTLYTPYIMFYVTFYLPTVNAFKKLLGNKKCALTVSK